MATSKTQLFPHSATTQNAVALFIFTIPMGTRNEDLFISPIYRSVRDNITKKCHCEFSVFDGNTLLPLTHSTPNRNFGQPPTDLLINIANPHDELLFTRGNWVIQVVYLTEPSRHYLFLKLINDFATKMKSFGDAKGGYGKASVSQGFKYTTVVALAHEKLREAFPGERNVSVDDVLIKEAKSEKQVVEKDLVSPREWGELPTVKVEHNYGEMMGHVSTLKLHQGGDLMTMEEGNLQKASEHMENQLDTENNLNHNANCEDYIETFGVEVYNNEETESCLQTLEHELEGLARKMNLE
ncbi:unnamed protein product [Hymenolepis diminuta]|uniref:DUF4283 domain-containing protein n=1 Tax=Hymenolepis diminuta TaxID=6216 RepID=A0A0R3SEV9_HYMDI|nr:unnamed protein product [Hymenolepis diminuta]VUZ43458.1 unnamed protein product [Hymenolepis diminuta]